MNVEKGLGQIFPEAQYWTMLISGALVPPIPKFQIPTFKKRKPDIAEFGQEEFLRRFFKRIGERAAEMVPETDVKALTELAMLKAFKEFQNSFNNPP